MAFPSFANNPTPFGNLGTNSNGGDTTSGSELVEISTEALGFHALAGESKLRLVPRWPTDSLPPPNSSLLSVANGKGLLAAAGPDSVIIASTEAVRLAFQGPGNEKFKSFTPQLTLNLGVRISQVAFSANEDFLALSAETGGGLAIYDVSSLLQGTTQPAFEMSTSGTSLRALLPNPKAETAENLAVVTANGQLMIADLKSRQFLSGPNGQVLRENVSTASWSNKGKQIVAGLGNGSCVQMTPDGQVKAEIPAPSGLDGEQIVSALNWLENDIFLTAHTSSSPDGSGMTPTTTYHIISRAKSPPNTFSLQKLPELSPPFGLQRTPAFQFMSRLRQYPPSLDDAIVVVSTASADVSIVTRSKSPLSNEFPEAQLANAYTSTLMADDAKRASLPITEGLADTSPIGMVFDLSSKDKVKKPIPGEEFEESPHPLPALLVLNNEGILAAWWFIYADSIRQGTIYPGLTTMNGLLTNPGSTQQTPSPSKPAQTLGSAFGQSAFGKPPVATALFGSTQQPSSTPAFGASSNVGSAFGAPSGLGAKASPWINSTIGPNSGATFGQPSFGTPNQLGGASQSTAFGSTSGLGAKSSPWGSSSPTPAASGPTFGQAGGLGASGLTFGATSTPSGAAPNTNAPIPVGFASFATKNPFAAAPSSSGSNLFGKPAATMPFNTQTSSNAFGHPESNQAQSPFNKGAFKLGSTFQSDGTAANDDPKPTGKSAPPLFGGTFGSALGGVAAAQTKDADMSDGQDEPSPATSTPRKHAERSAPAMPNSTSKPQKDIQNGPSQLFGKPPEVADPSSKPTESKTAGFSFGSTAPNVKAHDNSRTPQKPDASVEASPNIKKEPLSDDSLSDQGSISSLNDDEAQPPEGFGASDERGLARPDEAPETPAMSPSSPLPPESTSKTVYAAGDSSSSSKISDDAPLPPDFAARKPQASDETYPDKTELPQDTAEENESLDDGDGEGHGEVDNSGTLDDEGSGVDVGQELSPASSKNSSKATPGSSFGQTRSKAADTNLFSPQRSSSPSSKPAQPGSLFGPSGNLPLFGESGKPSIPLYASQKIQESPRSPSPVRKDESLNALRPESSRSVTAPNVLLGQNKSTGRLNPALAPSMPPLSAKGVRNQERGSLAAARSRLVEKEPAVLSDDEDEHNQNILNTEVTPSRNLDKFIAHQDYVSDEVKPGISGQIEKMFRDINSMIDTLGLNSRSLVAFTKGHEDSSSRQDQGHKDLDRLEDWCLVDVEDLDSEEDVLQDRLDQQKVQIVPEKLAEIQGIREKLSNVKRQSQDLGRVINNSKIPPTSQANAQKPLNLDQQTQLKDLRKTFAQFQKQLADAENSIVLLRTKLSSQTDGVRSNGKAKLKQPTVEAVENTIRKMTSLISQKSEDIDDLSLQLGDLRMDSPSGSSALDESNSRASRHGSPSSSSPFQGSSQRDRLSSRRNGYDPRRSTNAYQQSPLRGSQSTNGGAPGAGEFFSPEERSLHRLRVKTRQEVNEAVKGVFGGSQLKVRALD